MSKAQNKIIAKLDRLRQQLVDLKIDCYRRESYKGVPHLVINTEPFTMSICWFAHRRLWKVFWPYPSNYQKQRYEKFTTEQQVIDYIVEKKKSS